jgi:UDP-N-acetylmuramyl pentapeptide synthase
MNTAEIMARQMRLSELLEKELDLESNLDVELTGIETDSRLIEAGDLFLAYKGAIRMGEVLFMMQLKRVLMPCWWKLI